MPANLLDSGAISRLAERSTRALALLRSLRAALLWPLVLPSVVLVESLQGRDAEDLQALAAHADGTLSPNSRAQVYPKGNISRI